MAAYLVSYDLRNYDVDHRRMDRELQDMGAVKILTTTWLLEYYGGAKALRDEIGSIDLDDGIIVVEISTSADWALTRLKNQADAKKILPP